MFLKPDCNYRFKTPGKINHYLNILHKLPTGKHNLILDYFPISLTDEIQILPSTQRRVDIVNSGINNQKEDILHTLIKEVEAFCNVKFSMYVTVKKNIPIGSGLGGGSSNAGCMLVVMNRIFRLGIDEDSLYEIALKVGSDVPFFLNRRPGLYQHGVIDQLKRFYHMPKKIALIFPEFVTSTLEAFNAVTPYAKMQAVDYHGLDYKQWCSHPTEINDFWNEHHPKFKELSSIKEKAIDAGFDAVFLTGSGSTLYAMCHDSYRFLHAFKRFTTDYDISAVTANTLNCYPMIID